MKMPNNIVAFRKIFIINLYMLGCMYPNILKANKNEDHYNKFDKKGSFISFVSH